jgi:hypothetical protein
MQTSSSRQFDDNNAKNCDDLFLHRRLFTFFEAITNIYKCQLKFSFVSARISRFIRKFIFYCFTNLPFCQAKL